MYKNKLLLALIILLLTIPSQTFALEKNTWQKDTDVVTRVSGSDRYTTNIAASDKWMAKDDVELGDYKDSVVLVSGQSFPDSIIAVPLANATSNSRFGTSVLMHDPSLTTISGGVDNQIRSLLNHSTDKIYLIGGLTESILPGTLNYSRERISGSDRYETAYKVGKKVLDHSATDTVIIINGTNFADAIGVLGWAGNNKVPILLTPGDSLSPWVSQLIAEEKYPNGNISKAIIMGGTSVVSSTVSSQLSSLGLSVTRYGGTDRYDTNRIFNEQKFSSEAAHWAFATTGEDFPDAISAGFNAARVGRPIILTPNNYLHSIQNTYITNQSKKHGQYLFIYLIGGSVTDDTKNQIFNAGWGWWAPWSTLYVNEINPTYELEIVSYMNFYSTFPTFINGNPITYENNIFMPKNQNLASFNVYTNLPYDVQFIDCLHDPFWEFLFGDIPDNEHDWSILSDAPQLISTSETYYVQHFVKRSNSSIPIPSASNLKIYDESQFKIYNGIIDYTDYIDDYPSFKFIDKKNL